MRRIGRPLRVVDAGRVADAVVVVVEVEPEGEVEEIWVGDDGGEDEGTGSTSGDWDDEHGVGGAEEAGSIEETGGVGGMAMMARRLRRN